MRIFTIGHGVRPADELVACLSAAGVETLVDVRRFPTSRRNPQHDAAALAPVLAEAGIAYRHVVELGGRRSGEPGEERFACVRTQAFRSYAARMGQPAWQDALTAALAAAAGREGTSSAATPDARIATRAAASETRRLVVLTSEVMAGSGRGRCGRSGDRPASFVTPGHAKGVAPQAGAP